jgi:FkbM family methyltransferase
MPKSILKQWLRKLPFAFTQNQRYDLLTRRIIRQSCQPQSNCIDAGTHKGEIFDYFLQYAPRGTHYGFEPIPVLFRQLKRKYRHCANCHLYNLALSDEKQLVSFNYVLTNPAYSGIKKRQYDRENERDVQIEVQTALLDQVIPENLPVRLIKIDVEGGEMCVLKGAERILSTCHPLVIFEFGIGGSDIYGTTPEVLFSFFAGFSYKISLLEDYLKNRDALTLQEFRDQFYQKKNFVFIAH